MPLRDLDLSSGGSHSRRVRHLRVYIPGESPEANAKGIQPEFLRKWITALLGALQSATGVPEDEIRIKAIVAGSVDTLVEAERTAVFDGMLDTVERIENRDGAADRATVRFIRMAPEATREVRWEIYEGKELVRSARSSPRAKRARRTQPPMAHLAVIECRVESLHFAPRAIVLRDEEDGRRREVSCTVEQTEVAMRLGNDPDDPILVATIVVSSTKHERLLSLRTVDEQDTWEAAMEKRAESWTVDGFLERRPDVLNLLRG